VAIASCTLSFLLIPFLSLEILFEGLKGCSPDNDFQISVTDRKMDSVKINGFWKEKNPVRKKKGIFWKEDSGRDKSF